LPWNVSAITISENMGDATYQVKPDEAVLFRGGHLTEASRANGNCGCPRSVPVQVAKAEPPAPPAATKPAESPAAAPPVIQPKSNTDLASAPPPSLPPASPERHLSVEAPFVFRGSDPLPDLAPNVAILRLENNKFVQLEPTVLPPPKLKKQPAKENTQAARKESHGFFSKVGAFFASIFH